MTSKLDIESRYTSLVSLRKATRAFITKKYNDRGNFGQMDESQLKILLQNFKSRCDRLESLNEECLELYIQIKKPSEQEVDEEVTKCDEYRERASECIVLIQDLVNSNTSGASAYQSRSFLKPPQTPLPSFEGNDTEDITRFLSEFDKAIEPYQYTDFDKFLLLKKQSLGKAGLLLGSLDGSKQTYREAKALLEQAFGNREIQKYNLISKLTTLSLKNTDPFELYSEFNNITSSLEKLYVTMRDLYKCCLWKALPHEYQTQYLAYSTDAVPELDVLKTNYFDVCRRVHNNGTQGQGKEKYSSSYKQKTPKSSPVLALATGVGNAKASHNPQVTKGKIFKQPYCNLCYRTGQPYSHKISLCKTYPTAQDKISKLRELGGCTKCTSLKHNTTNCNYQGDKCRTCQDLHHNILCTSNKSSGVSSTNSQGTYKTRQ